MMTKAVWGGALLVAGALATVAFLQTNDEPEVREANVVSKRSSASAASREGPRPTVDVSSRRTVGDRPADREAPLAAAPPQAAEVREQAAEAPAQLEVEVVEDVVRRELEELELDGEVMSKVTCPTPPRCLAEFSGPALESNFAPRLAEELSDSTGVDYRVASTVFSHVQEGSPDPTHATFASFYPAGDSKSEARDEVRRAVRSFRADLEAND